MVLIVKKEVLIKTAFITLGQLLKEESVVDSGGQAKWYLREHSVSVNNEPDDRRGRVPDVGLFFIRQNQSADTTEKDA